MDNYISCEFPQWFKSYVLNPHNGITDKLLNSLAWGPKRHVRTFDQWSVNGYKFHTASWAKGRKTNNSGVSVKGTGHGQVECIYYGVLNEIIELDFTGNLSWHLTVFKCSWFDPSIRGTKVCPKHGTVEIHSKRRYKGNDHFIFAQQAEQVYFTEYPKSTTEKKNWLAVIRTKARNRIDALDDNANDDDAPFQNETNSPPRLIEYDHVDIDLRDNMGQREEIEGSDGNSDEEILHTESSETEESLPIDLYLASD